MAAGNFEACLKEVLKHEGGYANHPSDPGGETMYGITISVARENGYSGPMRSIPMDVVRRIYKKKYWDVVSGDTLAPGVDLAVFDFAANSGPSRALSFLRNAIGGPDTDTINNLCDARLAFLQGLRTWGTFGKGWYRRVSEVRSMALQMAKGRSPVKEVITTIGTGGGAAAAAKEAGWDWPEVIGIGFAVAVIVGVAILIYKRRK